MYYTVNAITHRIMGSSLVRPDPQEEANGFRVPVYIIQGQHTGLTATPEPPKKVQPTPTKPDEVDAARLKAWNAQGVE